MTLKRIIFIQDYKQRMIISRSRIPSKTILNKRNILLGILRKRQQFDEIRTIRAVENCRRLVLEEVEKLFIKPYSYVFDINELVNNIYKETENIIMNELFGRFNRLIVWQIKKINSADWIADILSPIQKYHKTKKRTILITSCMETVSRKTLSDSIELLMNNSMITKLVCNIDISTILLRKLGINSSLETMELKDEIFNRIGGALYSIEVGLVQEMNNQIANIFYETHDLLLNSTLEHKIHLLKEKIAKQEIYESNLLEA